MEENKYTFENPEFKNTYRHTTSHILAQAVKRLYPEVKLAIGPAIENGFYYDFDAPFAITPEILEKIEAEMRKICKEKIKLERFELPRKEAIKFMEEREEPYKVELINDLPEDAVISFYKQGDFTDLCNFVGMCRKSGADIIGLNPVNVLGHCFPEEASPYSSVSRLFLNPIYIDVESVPEFRPEDRYQAEAEIADLNAADTIDYGRVYPLKMKVLQTLYRRMKEDPERMKAFDKFCRRKGEDLDNLATFQALYEDKWQDHWGGWRAWEKEYRKPGTLSLIHI